MSEINAFCPVGIGGTKGIDVSSLKIFVGGLSPDQSSKDLFDVFSPFGTIRESVVIPDRFRVRSRCYGFVTFKDEEAVNRVFAELPIIAPNGLKLSVVLAASNTKPRRAHFSVKHGTSGHKPLPTVREEEESTMNPLNIKQTNSVDSSKKISVYSDPSLYRTANIQPIAPAKLHIDDTNTTNKVGTQWPNEDIKRDYHNLQRVMMDKENNDPNLVKSWRSMPVQMEWGKSDRFSRPQSNDRGRDKKESLNAVNATQSSVSNMYPTENEYKCSRNGLIEQLTQSKRDVMATDESESVQIPCTGSDIGDEDKETALNTLDQLSIVDDLESVILDQVVDEVEQEMQCLSVATNTAQFASDCAATKIYRDHSTAMMYQQPPQNLVVPAINQQPLVFHQVPYTMAYTSVPAVVPTQYVSTQSVGNNVFNPPFYGRFPVNQAAYRSPSIGK